LQKHPALNSRWDGESLLASAAIHIGIAVDTDAGLLVPVVRDVAALTLRDVATRTLDLTD
jgi:pyruvate dehydrogenase E2 component (dihydrolipoamide acetyltransferase)